MLAWMMHEHCALILPHQEARHGRLVAPEQLGNLGGRHVVFLMPQIGQSDLLRGEKFARHS